MSSPTAEESSELTIHQLLEAGLHFGHQTKRWNPGMKRYIFDKRNGIHIIDLAKSLALLNIARQFVYDVVAKGRKVLMVGTKKQAQSVIKEAATRCGQPYVTTRWLGGTLTNSHTVRLSVKRYRELQKMDKDNTFASMSKKEVSRLRQELAKLDRNLCGIADMDGMPGCMFVVDVGREAIAVSEARALDIPVIAILDTNCNPDLIDYPIPGNDDAIRAIKLVVDAIAQSIEKADREYAKRAAEMAKKRAAEAAAKAAAAKAASALKEDSGAKAAEGKTAGAEETESEKAARARRKKPHADRGARKADPEKKPAVDVKKEHKAPAAPKAAPDAGGTEETADATSESPAKET